MEENTAKSGHKTGKWFGKRTDSVSCQETFLLSAKEIEAFSERLEEILLKLEVERQNRLRIRFSYEEAILRLRDHFGEAQVVELKVVQNFHRTVIQIEAAGDVYNPLGKTENELEDWSGSLLTSIGLSPLYSYSRGKNILRLSLRRKEINVGVRILIAIVLGLGLGAILRATCSPEFQTFLIESVFTPLYYFWIRMLTVLSGPVIFLMVCTAVLNTGTIREEGGNSRRIVLRYFVFSLAAALIGVLASGFFFRNLLFHEHALEFNVALYLDSLLRIMPENILAPLVDSDTPQLLFLAFVLGSGIYRVGAGADGFKQLVRQCNSVGLLMTEDVSNCVPFFVAVLLCLELVGGKLQTFAGMWGIFLLCVLLGGSAILLACLFISRKKRVPFKILFQKLWPSFTTAIRFGNLSEGYGRMLRSSVDELGLEEHYAGVSFPYGMALYMPVNVIGTLVFTVYAASQYQMEISLGWLLVAMVLAVVLFVATPPVPGANLLAYIIIFAQLQVPADALIDAMVFDILFGIFASAANQTLLQLELILQADRIGLLDKEKLRRVIKLPGKKKKA